MKNLHTAERVSSEDISDNYVFQRSLLAYLEAAKIVKGNILEVGAGMGYGIVYLAEKADNYLAVDKHPLSIPDSWENVRFQQMNIPPLRNIENDSFDFVVSFQVIEHIENDSLFIEEVHRVLKPGGAFIVTTPNKKMSLTRNPWHIREYSIDELKKLMNRYFSKVDSKGVFGNEKIMKYYNKNKKSVSEITKYDIFNLQYRLPRWMLQIPYDILNRINRRKLLNNNSSLVSSINYDDYKIANADQECFDLFFVGIK